MPSTSLRQHAFMEAIAHDPAFARRVGVPAGVGQEFVAADRHYADGGAVDDPLPEDEYAWLERALARRPRNRGYADGGPVSPYAGLNNMARGLTPAEMAQLQAQGPWGTAGGLNFTTTGLDQNTEGGSQQAPVGSTTGMAGYIPNTISGDAGGWENLYNPDGTFDKQYLSPGATSLDKGMEMLDEALLAYTFGTVAMGAAGAGAAGADPALGVQGDSINALDAHTGVGYGSDAAGAGGFTGSGLNPAFDTVGDITNINPLTTSGVGNGASLPMTPGGWEAATLPAAGSVPATSMGFDASLGLGLGSGVTAPGASGPSATTPASIGNSLSGMSPTDIAKLITSAVSAANGSSSQGSPAPQGYVSHQIDPGYSMLPPGWRSDRPLYVPGQDAIPDGWFGAGHTG